MKILYLTLKKKWFDLIKSGEKTEEYREIKPYWEKRFEGISSGKLHFKNGYSKKAPHFIIELKGIEIREGKEEWGAEKGKKYFVLKLGKIENTETLVNNIKSAIKNENDKI